MKNESDIDLRYGQKCGLKIAFDGLQQLQPELKQLVQEKVWLEII